MSKQVAMAALAFLERVQMQATEIEAYMAVRAAINEFIKDEEEVDEEV